MFTRAFRLCAEAVLIKTNRFLEIPSRYFMIYSSNSDAFIPSKNMVSNTVEKYLRIASYFLYTDWKSHARKIWDPFYKIYENLKKIKKGYWIVSYTDRLTTNSLTWHNCGNYQRHFYDPTKWLTRVRKRREKERPRWWNHWTTNESVSRVLLQTLILFV